MKIRTVLFSLIALAVLSSFTMHVLKTSLKVTVRNDLGNLESEASVSLYKTKEDYEKSINPVDTQITDEKGNAVFGNLESVVYYISAEKGDKNNFGAGEKTEKLVENRQNKVTIIISE
ncbi:hypothetical protein CHU_0212 [Sporocytophaga myxococcoides]|uniref:Prealbumin-like fold domain-containing protein n=1 Tax=Sporocytophaga myxococcoides TaxID=153721 RepID=A0A098L8S5_9BACT|nr:hypothetical protein [Sporocytophaga myxococcoides]GAL82947.1 hypothetical protein CHU_0212 [Sporocytophaga myxococcoides]